MTYSAPCATPLLRAVRVRTARGGSRLAFALTLFLLAGSWPADALAHAFSPGSLHIEASGRRQWQVTFRRPTITAASRLRPQWPDDCEAQPRPRVDNALRWTLHCKEPLQTIGVEGFISPAEEVLVRVDAEPHEPPQIHRLTMSSPTVQLSPQTARLGTTLIGYALLGVEHILVGYDHLAFILLLVLLSTSVRGVLLDLSLFTLAHSVTLSLSVLDVLVLDPRPTEIVIALSIVFAAREVLCPSLTHRENLVRRRVLAFGFGLLHGLGLAGALTEIGLPPGRAPEALIGFNLGVEVGQLICVAVMLAALSLAKQFAPRLRNRLPSAAAYGVGGLSVFWTVSRMVEIGYGI